MRNIAWRVADIILLVLLAIYIFAGVNRVPFHGDEGMQVYATLDYYVAVVQGNPADLPTNPPYTIDSRPHLRLINGSVQRYAAGFVLYTLRGHNEGDLPLPPGWNWGLRYAENVAGGWLPKDSILIPARYTSAAFFALSLPVMFALGVLIGGRVVAYPTVLLYGLHPVLLLNARRATMEGSVLLFGMLTMLLAVWMAQQLVANRRVHWLHWVGLVMAAAFAVASKHSSALLVLAAWVWLLVAAIVISITGKQWQPVLRTTGALFLAGIAAIVLFVGLSPALWSNPLARMGNLIEERANLLAIQVAVNEDAPSPLSLRARWALTQPYIEPAQYHEVSSWRLEPDIIWQQLTYEQAGVAGLPHQQWLRIPLTLLMVIGLMILVRRSIQQQQAGAIGLLLWFALVSVVLLFNPLPWQRYYLPLLPAAILITGVGASVPIRWICQQFPTHARISPIAADGIVGQTRDVP